MALSNLLSPSTIFVSLLVAYSSYSIWSMAQLFIPPVCQANQKCLKPILTDNPDYQFVAFYSLKLSPRSSSDVSFVFKENPFDYKETWEKNININIPQKVRSNGTMFLHMFLTSPKTNSEKWSSVVNDPMTIYESVSLTQYHIPEAKSFNLLGSSEGEDDSKKLPSSDDRPVTHFFSQVVFNVLTDSFPIPTDGVPYEIGRNLRLSPSGKYLPVMRVDFMSLRINNLSLGPFRRSPGVDAKFGLHRIKTLDEVKGIFSDSNLYLLGITFFVSTLHMVFDFLAFKNDINFWRGLKSMGGISPTTVVWRTFAQLVIFLFLLEEETSLLVLVPAGIGALIEIWKVTKAFHIKFEGWRLKITHVLTKEESNTKELDSEGLRYLSYIMYPLCLGGAIYSLLYTPHKSWYSWLINSLVNGIYAFGFLFMMPQLFINYKLKSVAHLPWRAFMLLYPVDKSRFNEYGQSGIEEEKKKKKKKE
ncbi:Cleft lip and palate transmembrane protein 1-like protein [Armadillidium nasatum]|uniref:Lipid scramblase CLPTM1L n=1 Tax=Armadillidium nasatum TaxID=96803 RepID=A0A5N5TNN0_9CRUS|nr:Cleft lip and palate transmembrane protein 1-like protein [Armadillidium nasatum]